MQALKRLVWLKAIVVGFIALLLSAFCFGVSGLVSSRYNSVDYYYDSYINGESLLRIDAFGGSIGKDRVRFTYTYQEGTFTCSYEEGIFYLRGFNSDLISSFDNALYLRRIVL